MSKQPEIIIYTKDYCPYCVRAKNLLDSKRLEYKEIDITTNESLQQEMLSRSHGRKTVPQIFIGDHHVGGCDDLYALEGARELDKLLKVIK